MTEDPRPMPAAGPDIAVVVIGRNEGERLVHCLEALRALIAGRVVYVDSGSTDGSVDAARRLGAEVVELDMSRPFTAGRARNAGLDRLREDAPPALVQFIDGDCELRAGWLPVATEFLRANPRAAVACGRVRERYPEASLWNRLCDAEWNTPVGKTAACGGIALVRWQALEAVGGFNPGLIAGEEPEMCLRLRARGWEIWRLEAEMALHDAAMTRFGQFWQRARRAGHAWAEGAALHGRGSERHGVAGLRRALFWGLALPLAAVSGALASPWALLLLLAYPAQVVRLARRAGGGRFAWERALFLTLSKFAEAQGALGFGLRRLRGGPARLIEYK